MAETTLTWGILGTGGIARTFARGVAASRTGTLIGVGSRTQEAATQFGEEFGIAENKRYPSYDALLADPQIQAVYISLPNHLHAEWTIKCAAAGKHILCEKPLTTNHAEAMIVLEAVRRYDVFLMEAFMYRCHPQTARLKELIEQKVIGDVRLIQCSFSFNMGPKYENIRLSNPAAGGGIMDVGCYTASMSRLIAGAEPVEIKGTAHIGEISRVDEQATASLLFPGGIVANLACGTQVSVDQELRIWGSEGHIRVPNPWFPKPEGNRIVIKKDGDSEPTEIVVDGGGELYAIEADMVARHIADRQAPSPCMTWKDSLNNMAVLDAWRHSVGLVFDVEKPAALRGPTPALVAPAPANAAPMPYGTIPGLDRPVSRLILGAMVLSAHDVTHNCALLDSFVARGGTMIDTAHVYGSGAADRAVGQWLSLRGNRDKVMILGKGAHHNARGPRVTPEAIASDLADSLSWLQTHYIDLYVLHRDDPSRSVNDIIDALNEHQRAGRIRAFGASNWTAARIAEANAYAAANGLAGFVASSPNFSLAVPNEVPWSGCLSVTLAGAEELAWYRQNQFPLLSWSSQAQGFFTGPYTPDNRANKEMVRVWYSDDNFQRQARAAELGRRKGATANQIALAYVLHQDFPTFALIGPRTLEELRTSLDALNVALTPDEIRWLNLEV